MATQQDFDRLIAQLRQQLATLGPDAPAFERMVQALEQATRQSQNFAQGLQDGQVILGSINARINEINNELGYTFKSFQSIVNEMTRGNATIGNITKGVKSLTDVAQKLVNRQTEYGKLTAKELEKLKKQSALNFQNLRLEREYLQEKQRSNSLTNKEALYLTELNGILQDSIGLEQSFTRQINAALEEQKAIEESLGITGNLLKGIASLPGLQSLSAYLDVSKATEDMEAYAKKLIEAVKETPRFKEAFYLANLEIQSITDELGLLNEQLEAAVANGQAYDHIQEEINRKTGKLNEALAKRAELERNATLAATSFVGKLGTAIVGMNSLLGGFVKALTDPVTIFLTLLKTMGSINKEINTLQKNLVLSYGQASNLRGEFALFAAKQQDVFYTSERLLASQAKYNEFLGLQGKLSLENTKTFTALTERVGVAEESAARLQYFSEATGKDFNEQYKNAAAVTQAVSAQYGVQLLHRKVLTEVGKASSYTLLQFKGSTVALTKAVAEAQALGTTLENTQKSGKALLNFEQSIQDELEAELLTGKQINLEQARYYALTNQVGKLQTELGNELGSYEDFINTNVIAQESYAKALGKSVEEVSDMLLMEQYGKLNRQQLVALGKEEVADRIEAVTLAQDFDNAMKKVQRTLADIAAGPLGTIAEIFGNILSSVGGLSTLLGIIAGVQIFKLVHGIQQALAAQASLNALNVIAANTAAAEATASVVTASAKSFGLGVPTIIAGIAAVLGGIGAYYALRPGDQAAQKAEDLFSAAPGGGGHGKRMLLGPEGAFALSNRDNILATTNPIPVNDMRVSAAGNQQIQVVVQSMLDGQLVGQGLEVASYKTSS